MNHRMLFEYVDRRRQGYTHADAIRAVASRHGVHDQTAALIIESAQREVARHDRKEKAA